MAKLDDLDEDGGAVADAAPSWDGPSWNPRLAVELVGKHILVGITAVAPDGKPLGHRHVHSYAVRADQRAGIALRLEGEGAGAEMLLPPDTGAFRPAPPGEYRLRGTGEVVTDPDFLTTWTVRQRDRSRDH